MADLSCSNQLDKEATLNCRYPHVPEVADDQKQCPSEEEGLLAGVKQGAGQNPQDSHREMVPMSKDLKAGFSGG